HLPLMVGGASLHRRSPTMIYSFDLTENRELRTTHENWHHRSAASRQDIFISHSDQGKSFRARVSEPARGPHRSRESPRRAPRQAGRALQPEEADARFGRI